MLDNLSIVLPVKNECENLKFILPKIKKFSDDIIVVDGNSNDGSKEICESLNIKFILDNNLGKGDAQKLGVKEAKNDYIIFIDGDGSHDLMDVEKLYKHITENNHDLVLGSRMTGGSLDIISNTSFIGFIRFIGNNFLILLFNLVFKKKLTEVLYSFRILKKKSFIEANITANKFDIELDILIKFTIKKFKISELPSREMKRVHGKSKLNTIVGIMFIAQILKYLFVKK